MKILRKIVMYCCGSDLSKPHSLVDACDELPASRSYRPCAGQGRSGDYVEYAKTTTETANSTATMPTRRRRTKRPIRGHDPLTRLRGAEATVRLDAGFSTSDRARRVARRRRHSARAPSEGSSCPGLTVSSGVAGDQVEYRWRSSSPKMRWAVAHQPSRNERADSSSMLADDGEGEEDDDRRGRGWAAAAEHHS